jgi:hypothetical protein
MIDNKEKLFLTAYSKEMSTFPKWNQESFCEAWKILKITDLKKIDLKFNDYRDIKLQVASYLKNKYETTN